MFKCCYSSKKKNWLCFRISFATYDPRCHAIQCSKKKKSLTFVTHQLLFIIILMSWWLVIFICFHNKLNLTIGIREYAPTHECILVCRFECYWTRNNSLRRRIKWEKIEQLDHRNSKHTHKTDCTDKFQRLQILFWVSSH